MHGNCESTLIADDQNIVALASVVGQTDPVCPRLDDLQELHRILRQYPSPLDAAAVLQPHLSAALLRLVAAHPTPPASEQELQARMTYKALLTLFSGGAD